MGSQRGYSVTWRINKLLSKRKTSMKLRVDIRVDGKGDYVIAVMRPLPKKGEFNPHSEIYVCDTIEEMESIVSQLFRTGKVKRK